MLKLICEGRPTTADLSPLLTKSRLVMNAPPFLLLLAATVCVITTLLSGRGSTPAHDHNTHQSAPRTIAKEHFGSPLSRSHAPDQGPDRLSGVTTPLLRKSEAAVAREVPANLWCTVTAAFASMLRRSSARPSALVYDMWRTDPESDASADSDACDHIALNSKQQQVCAISS